MKAVVQCVSTASVSVDAVQVAKIDRGMLVLLGVTHSDTSAHAKRLWEKIASLRIFADSSGKTNLALSDIDGSVLIVSQFTLYADCKKGNRPSFSAAARSALAEELYTYFIHCAKQDKFKVEHGVFGADMQVSLINDGPFTVIIDTDDLNVKVS